MADQETVTTETTTSTETETNTSPEPGSSSSTTENQPGVDLAGETENEVEDTRTDEEKAADEKVEAERAELFGTPEGDAYAVEGLPEGMEIDKDALDAIIPVAKQLNLSSKGLSTIAQVYAEKVLPGVMKRAEDAIVQQVTAQRSEWEGEAEAAIKDNGHSLKNAAGETLSFDAKDKAHVLKTAAKALDRLAPAGFREFLKETGLSVHPAMVAFAYQAGKSISEDTDHETAQTGSGKPKSRSEKYYG